MAELALNDILPHVQNELSKTSRDALYRADPVAWVEGYLGLQLWSKQKEILYSVRDNHNTAVAAGHSVGKSYVAGLLVCWWVDTHPINETFVATTAPFADQISAILFQNILKVWMLARDRHEKYLELKEAGKPLGEYENADHALPGYVLTGNNNQWKTKDGVILAQGRKPPDNKADSGFQGLHAPYLLAIGDEAAGLNQDMLNALGNIATGEHNRVLLIANPTDPSSAMAKIWDKKLSSWNRMHISVMESPMIQKEKGFDLKRAEGMSGQEYVDSMREQFGEDSAEYKIRVLGQWAFDKGNGVFSDSDIARAVNTVVEPYADERKYMQMGIDIARGGKDFTELYSCEEGEIYEQDENGRNTVPTGRTGYKIRYVQSWQNENLTWSDPEKPGTAELADRHMRGAGATLGVLDLAGYGGEVIKHMNAYADGTYLTLGFQGSNPPTERASYNNIRTQSIFELRLAMARGEVDIDEHDEALHNQMRSVIFDFNNKGQKAVEGKDSMRRRGVKSPDKVDAAYYSFIDASQVFSELSGVTPGERLYADLNEYADTEAIYSDAYGM